MSDVITFRVSPHVRALLEARARETGWSRSQVARFIVMAHLEKDPEAALIQHAAFAIGAHLESQMPRVWQRVYQIVQEELAEPIARLAKGQRVLPDIDESGPVIIEAEDEEVESSAADDSPEASTDEALAPQMMTEAGPLTGTGSRKKKRRRGSRGGRRR